MALNPITFTEQVVSDFLRYQLTTYPLADVDLHAQLRALLPVSPALALGLCAATTGAALHWTAGRYLHESTAAGVFAASLFAAGIALATAIGSA